MISTQERTPYGHIIFREEHLRACFENLEPVSPQLYRAFPYAGCHTVEITVRDEGDRVVATYQDNLFSMQRYSTGQSVATAGVFYAARGCSRRDAVDELCIWIYQGRPRRRSLLDRITDRLFNKTTRRKP